MLYQPVGTKVESSYQCLRQFQGNLKWCQRIEFGQNVRCRSWRRIQCVDVVDGSSLSSCIRKVMSSSSSLFLLEEGPGHRSRTLKVRKWNCDVFFFHTYRRCQYVNKSPSSSEPWVVFKGLAGPDHGGGPSCVRWVDFSGI
jgi:hypothetical protein